MQMQRSPDGRYYHGKSLTDGYVFVEVAIADQFHQTWIQNHPKAPETLKQSMHTLHYSASFWDMTQLEGAHVLQHYIKVELLLPQHYRVSCMDHGQRLWDYALRERQLQTWLPTLSHLIETTPDPLCGIYQIPLKTDAPLWDREATRETAKAPQANS